MQCPFCMKQVRGVGAIVLFTPDQWGHVVTGLVTTNDADPIAGPCCADCLGLLAMTIDGLRNGGILALANKMADRGAIQRLN